MVNDHKGALVEANDSYNITTHTSLILRGFADRQTT